MVLVPVRRGSLGEKRNPVNPNPRTGGKPMSYSATVEMLGRNPGDLASRRNALLSKTTVVEL